jgi:hypothetical protein
MEEQASFEARAVLAPRRARLSRLALLVPVVALVAIAWAGISGNRSDQATAELPGSTAAGAQPVAGASPVAGSSPVAQAAPPAQLPERVLGISVRRLADVQPRGLGRGGVIAVSGWYVPKAITDCPPLAAIYKDGSLPYLRGDKDKLAFCVRSGLFYASRPDLDERLPSNNLEDNRSKNAGLPVVAATLGIGVVAPLELEQIGMDATQVVFVAHFVEPGDDCRAATGCPRELLVDHVAWTPLGPA